MLRIYGDARTRAFRCAWLLRELAVEFEHVPVDLGAARSIEFLAINPNGKVPALVDGTFVVWESIAINLYLTKKYGGELAPRTLEEEALILQWSLWVVSECEQNALAVFNHKFPRFGRQPSDAEAAQAAQRLKQPLSVLEQALASKPYLLGDRFTVADLNVVSILAGAKAAGLDLGDVPDVARWFSSCLRRPAQRETVRAMTVA
jgi:glutathione S-transferase